MNETGNLPSRGEREETRFGTGSDRTPGTGGGGGKMYNFRTRVAMDFYLYAKIIA